MPRHVYLFTFCEAAVHFVQKNYIFMFCSQHCYFRHEVHAAAATRTLNKPELLVAAI